MDQANNGWTPREQAWSTSLPYRLHARRQESAAPAGRAPSAPHPRIAGRARPLSTAGVARSVAADVGIFAGAPRLAILAEGE